MAQTQSRSNKVHTRLLDLDNFTKQFFTISLLNSLHSRSVIFEVHKAVEVLQGYRSDLAELTKQIFDLPLRGASRDPRHVNLSKGIGVGVSVVFVPRSLLLFIISDFLLVNRVSTIKVTGRSLVLAVAEFVFFVSPLLVLESIHLVGLVLLSGRFLPAI